MRQTRRIPLKRSIAINAHMASRATMALARDAGCGSVRLDAPLPDIHPGPHDWSLDTLDESVFAAREFDLEVLLTVSGVPAWMSGGPGVNRPPLDPSAWADAVRVLCKRYWHNVWYWSIFNEPNRQNYWSGTVGAYLHDLFLTAAEVIHETPENKVCGPEITLMDNWSDWLATFLLGGGGRAVDILTLHCYEKTGLQVMRTMGAVRRRWWEVYPTARQVIERVGYGSKPVWLTETGWSTDRYEQASHYDQVFESLPNAPWLERVFGYQLIDEPGVSYGIYEINGAPKPAVEVFKRRST